MTVSLILDGVVAGLLAATIGYAMVLNRKLAEMRNAKAEMEAMVRQFAEATAQAQRGLADLKAATAASGDSLQKRLGEAKALSQDLSFLVEKGSGLADRLETQIAAGRGRPAASPQPPHDGSLAEDVPAAEGATERATRLHAVEKGGAAQAAGRRVRTGTLGDQEPPARKVEVGRGNAKLLHALRAMR